MSRVLVVFACSSLLAGCAGEQTSVSSLAPAIAAPSNGGWKTGVTQLSGLGAKQQAAAALHSAGGVQSSPKIMGFYQPPKVVLTDEDRELMQAAKKTMAGKVLGAIALEQVTGRKPDPARFGQ
jgi:ABC-type uncharacterized transport system ATPase subunit